MHDQVTGPDALIPNLLDGLSKALYSAPLAQGDLTITEGGDDSIASSHFAALAYQ
jgi:hypothetical protein